MYQYKERSRIFFFYGFCTGMVFPVHPGIGARYFRANYLKTDVKSWVVNENKLYLSLRQPA